MHCQDTGVLPLKIVQCYSDILFQEIMFIDPSKSHFAVQWQMHLRQLNYLNFDFLLCCWPKRNRISIPFVHDLNDVNRPKRKTVIKGIPRLSTENMHECDPLNTYFSQTRPCIRKPTPTHTLRRSEHSFNFFY